MLKDVINIVFPQHCNACKASLLLQEKHICTLCRNELPLATDNQLESILNELNLSSTYIIANFTSLFYFEKNTPVQEILHNLKYRNHRHLGKTIAEWHAPIITQNENFNKIDIVIPMPLHRKRLRERGYNQVALYAKTIAAKLDATYNESILLKTKHLKSQVFLSKKERFQNILESLEVQNDNLLKGKHILIVDDLITTGATIQACVSCLQSTSVASISIASMAIAVLEN